MTNYYDKQAMIDTDSRFQRYRIRNLLRLYEPHPSETVLDIGCGWGTITAALKGNVKKVIGIDSDPKAIELCQKNYPDSQFMQANAYTLPFPDESIDVIIMFDFIEHVPNFNGTAIAITEATRVLKLGGLLIIWTPCRSHFIEILKNRNIILKKDESHIGYETMGNLITTLQYAGHRISQAYYWGSHLPGLCVIEYMFRWIPIFRRRIAIAAQKQHRSSCGET